MTETEFSIVHTIGETFLGNTPVDRWPLHMTIIPPFELGEKATVPMIVDRVRQSGQAIGPIELRYGSLRSGAIPLEIGNEVFFGENNDIQAIEIEDPSGALHELHSKLLPELGKLGVRYLNLNPEWSGNNYHPHTTTKNGHVLDRPFFCSSVTLFQKRNDGKRIIETIDLVNN